MNRTRAQHLAVFVALVLLVAGAARAQAQAAPPPGAEAGAARAPVAPPPAPQPPAPRPPAHVRSSHTVDVIAPGEQVDTILGRMRVERPRRPRGVTRSAALRHEGPRTTRPGAPRTTRPGAPRTTRPGAPRPPPGPGRSGRRVLVMTGGCGLPRADRRRPAAPLFAANASAPTMMVVPVLTLVAMLAAADPLAEPKQALAEGRYEEAERLAVQAAQAPRLGAALYLVGLARFRAGRPAEALEALEAAGRAEDAPARAPWSFNRGACL